MSWVKINERLFELESIPEDKRDSDWKNEWNTLLNSKVAGILVRNKYEESKGTSEGKKTKKERRKRKNVGNV